MLAIIVKLGSNEPDFKRFPFPPNLHWDSAMTDHVYRKYPEHAKAIQALRNKDADFSEMCDDYEEMSTWLASQNRSIDPHSEECVQAQEIIGNLEDEIIKKLEEYQ